MPGRVLSGESYETVVALCVMHNIDVMCVCD